MDTERVQQAVVGLQSGLVMRGVARLRERLNESERGKLLGPAEAVVRQRRAALESAILDAAGVREIRVFIEAAAFAPLQESRVRGEQARALLAKLDAKVSPPPTIRYTPDDEIVADGAHVQLERMDATAFWLKVNGSTWNLAARGAIRMSAQDNEPEAGE